VFFGKIEGVNDLVTFEGDTVKQIKKAFKEAVEDYIELCQEAGKAVFKSFKGSFNVRINPELHSQAFGRALEEGKTLNQFVQDAIETKLQSVN
jgi:predicted HicB family RNase H-like nuclease